VAANDEGRWGRHGGGSGGNGSSPGRVPHSGAARQEVGGGAREDVEVWVSGVEPVVAKPGVDGGQRWWSVWRQFPDGEGDGGVPE
jgi:hypothetical protein